MTDLIFGELKKDDNYDDYLCGKLTLDFGKTSCTVELLISQSDEEERVTDSQYEAFHYFIEKWPSLQADLIAALIKYYNEEQRFSWGPDDEEELAKWWPEIKTEEALLQAVTLETMVIPWDFTMDRVKGRYLYLLFSRTWGGEDLDDNGIGVGFLNEKIDEISYKDIAF